MKTRKAIKERFVVCYVEYNGNVVLDRIEDNEEQAKFAIERLASDGWVDPFYYKANCIIYEEA